MIYAMHWKIYLMNNEIKDIQMGLLTALVLVATVGVLTIVVMSPNGGFTTSAHAFMKADPSEKGSHYIPPSGMGTTECDCIFADPAGPGMH